MSIVFDGRAFSDKRELEISQKVANLGDKPKLVTFLIGDNPASQMYVELKRKACERVGIELEIQDKLQLIESLNNDLSVDGIMIQLPLPSEFSKEDVQQIIHKINPGKDVDGMRDDSPFLPATVKAIFTIMDEAKVNKNMKIAIVGAKGEVGRRLLKVLMEKNYEAIGYDKEDNLSGIASADVVVSATGVPGLIKAEMVKEGAVVIDVGAPKEEVDFENVSKKASFITPVPGGVGPVTVVSLMENVMEASYVF